MVNPEEKPRRDEIEHELRRLKLDVVPPRVKTKRPSLGWLAAALACLAVVAIAARFLPRNFRGGAEVEVVVVSTQETQQAPSTLAVVGYVTAVEQVQVMSPMAARAAGVYTREGEMVRRGQLLAQLDDAGIRAQIGEARAVLQNAQAHLALLEHGPRPQEIERSSAEVEEMEVSAKENLSKLQRLKLLASEGLVSAQEVSEAEARYNVSIAQLKGARQRAEITRLGPREEEIASARAQVQQAVASLQAQEAQLEYAQIKSPIAGLVVRKNLSAGEIASPSATQPLFVIINPASLKVDADVNQSDLPKVHVGAAATVAVEGLSGRSYEGSVAEILPEADRQKNTIKVRVSLADADQNLRPGMSARVNLYERQERQEPRRAIIIPKTAVVEEGGQNYVFVAEDGREMRRRVVLGAAFDDRLEVTAGLAQGEKLIIRGHESLADGSPVSIK